MDDALIKLNQDVCMRTQVKELCQSANEFSWCNLVFGYSLGLLTGVCLLAMWRYM